jgi:hypothetical protein
MADCWEEEHKEGGNLTAESFLKEWIVDMSDTPPVDWQVPQSPIFVDSLAVPPILNSEIFTS